MIQTFALVSGAGRAMHLAMMTDARNDFELDHGGGRPWGFWVTLGFGIAVSVVFVLVQFVVAFWRGSALAEANRWADAEQLTAMLERDGYFLSLATIGTGLLCSLLVVVFAMIRRGVPVADSLGLPPTPPSVFFTWFGLALIMVTAVDISPHLLGFEVVPEFLTEVYASAPNRILFWIALVVMAPLFEEIFFRGFLFAGWSRSKLGVSGAVVLTSALWAAIHVQYELYYVGVIFVVGLFLGFVRYRSGSLYLPLAIHAAMNLIATLQAAVMQ